MVVLSHGVFDDSVVPLPKGVSAKGGVSIRSSCRFEVPRPDEKVGWTLRFVLK